MPAAALREVPETLVGFHPFPLALRAERPLPARLQSIRQCGQGLRAGIAGRDCGPGGGALGWKPHPKGVVREGQSGSGAAYKSAACEQLGRLKGVGHPCPHPGSLLGFISQGR